MAVDRSVCDNKECIKKETCWHFVKENVIPKVLRTYANRENLDEQGICLEYKPVTLHDINLS